MIVRYILVWFILVVVAILNAALREKVFCNYMGELTAHQASTLSIIVFFGLIIWGVTQVWPLQSSAQAWTVGLIWLVMTVAFEFLFGHYVMGNSWNRLLHDYNIFAGRVWVLVLIWLATAPYVFYRFRL